MFDTFQSTLYQRLQAFELNNPTHEIGFTRHLMRSQGWTQFYAERAIAEYRKFAFLTVVANHQVVPSDSVDQVWHTHMLFTQSYWEEFCPKVLGKTLHHHPTRGGRAERAAFHRLYAQTIASYRQFFGSPPTDIWSPPDVRFGAELKMQRVSLSDHWVIPKRFPSLKVAQPLIAIAIVACLAIGGVSVAQASTAEATVSGFSANQYAAAMGGAVLLGLITRYVIRRPSHQPQKPPLDPYQIAYLAGKEARAVELAIVQLVHGGYLRPHVGLRPDASSRFFTIAKPLPATAPSLEKEVMQQVLRAPEFKRLRQPTLYRTKFLRESLERDKLLMKRRAELIGQSFGFVIALPVLLLFLAVPLAIVMTILSTLISISGIPVPGIQIADPNAFVVPYPLIGIFTFFCFVPSGRTAWGSRVLADIHKNHDFYNVAHRFALYGYKTLSGGALDDLKQMYEAEAAEAAKEASGACGC